MSLPYMPPFMSLHFEIDRFHFSDCIEHVLFWTLRRVQGSECLFQETFKVSFLVFSHGDPGDSISQHLRQVDIILIDGTWAQGLLPIILPSHTQQTATEKGPKD